MLALAALVGGLYAFGALLMFWYFEAPAEGVTFFLPAGLTLATLLITPRRTWPLWLAAIAIAEISVDLAHGQGVLMAFGFALANTLEPVVGAHLTRTTATNRHASPRGYLVAYVACAVIAGPFVGAVVGASVSTIAGASTFFATMGRWWLGDALGVLVVATPALGWRERQFYRTPASVAEMLGIAALAVVVIVVPAIYFGESAAFAVLPILMIAAIRGGPLAVGISGFAVAVSSSWVVATGRAEALLAIRNHDEALIYTQLFIGVTVLSALILAVEVAERMRVEYLLRQAERQRMHAELTALQAATRERRRIVRETHDIMGHALNVILLSGGAARRVLEYDIAQARELLGTVEEVGREAFRDLDVALGLIDVSDDMAPRKGLHDLEELVARLVRSGMDVEYEIEGTPRPIPRLVDGSAFRIVQESLTNVVRHAGHAHTRVHVRFLPTMLQLEVADYATEGASPNGAGRGLVGMQERVAVLGGRMRAGQTDAGYSVVAELPLEQL